MSKEIFEDAIEHANLCLKHWQVAKKNHVTSYIEVRSLILTMLNKACSAHFVGSGYHNYRDRAAIARGLRDSISFTMESDDIHITSVTVSNRITGKAFEFPDLDYDMLNTRANARFNLTGNARDVSSITFESITQIKFT